jgi:hypothetical protein
MLSYYSYLSSWPCKSIKGSSIWEVSNYQTTFISNIKTDIYGLQVPDGEYVCCNAGTGFTSSVSSDATYPMYSRQPVSVVWTRDVGLYTCSHCGMYWPAYWRRSMSASQVTASVTTIIKRCYTLFLSIFTYILYGKTNFMDWPMWKVQF